MEDRAYRNCLAGNFSEGASLQGWRVTRRSIRAGSWYFSQKTVTVQGGYGTCFCRPGTEFYEHYACRACPVRAQRVTGVQIWSEPQIYHRLQNWLGALAQCRGTKLIEAKKLSRYTGFKLRADARVRVQQPLRICLGSRSKSKNHDKQLTHIVRVMLRTYFYCIYDSS
jgi:hypothetical protein